jgi:hypothetical protein
MPHDIDLQFSSLSSEFIRSRVDAKENGVQVDPTGDAVSWAFETSKAAEPTSFTSGSWETDNTGPDPVYYARIQVGPGGAIVLTDDTYWVWLKVTDAPEVPVRQVGKLVIT